MDTVSIVIYWSGGQPKRGYRAVAHPKSKIIIIIIIKKDKVISKVFRNLLFIRNQPPKSYGDYKVGILKNKTRNIESLRRS